MKVIAALTVAAGLLVAVPPTAEAQETCNGQPATVVGSPGETLTGTNGRDVVVTNGAASVDTFDGIDVVCVTGGVPAQMDAGPGRDRVVIALPEGRVVLDLGAETLSQTPGGDATVVGFEDATVRAHSMRVDGTTGPNDIRWNTCLATITAQRGADKVRWAGGADLCLPEDDRTVGLFGGGGKDVLAGSPWADILVGGRGLDRGDGQGGRDRCRVEHPQRCESDR